MVDTLEDSGCLQLSLTSLPGFFSDTDYVLPLGFPLILSIDFLCPFYIFCHLCILIRAYKGTQLRGTLDLPLLYHWGRNRGPQVWNTMSLLKGKVVELNYQRISDS